MAQQLISALDPQTYGFNRNAVTLGLVAVGFLVFVGVKLLDVLHQAGLPVAK
jgi:hypothetical protein